MIVGLTIRNFKGISAIENLPLSSFHVLVGPNGVGKTTFLDAVDFVRDCLVQGPAAAVESRHIADFNDLTWMRRGGAIEIELWLDLSEQRPELAGSLLSYRLIVQQDEDRGIFIYSENLDKHSGDKFSFLSNFHCHKENSIIIERGSGNISIIFNEKEEKNDGFILSDDVLFLGEVFPDEERYPTANAVKRFLTQGIRSIQLNSQAMRLPCPATRPAELALDGTNLARVVGRLIGKRAGLGPHWPEPGSPVALWTEHLRYALPDLQAVGWARRQADNAEYLLLRYDNGLEAPSWMLSDGTLRMMALTLPAFMTPEPAIYLVEEPENGVHPKALEIILRSLSSTPGAQMLLATHSPLVVQQCGVEPLLCFSRDDGGVHITPGPDHPMLKGWDGTPDLSVVFAAGVLE